MKTMKSSESPTSFPTHIYRFDDDDFIGGPPTMHLAHSDEYDKYPSLFIAGVILVVLVGCYPLFWFIKRKLTELSSTYETIQTDSTHSVILRETELTNG